MQKRDFETYQKRFWDFQILPEFSETHVFRGTIRHPSSGISRTNHAIICLYYYQQHVCNFHMQLFQIKLKYHCLSQSNCR